MIGFVIVVILASIAVSVISTTLRLVPRYAKRRHRVLQRVLNTVLLTILLTILIVNNAEPGLVVTGSMIFLIFIASIIVTNLIAHKQGSNPTAEGK